MKWLVAPAGLGMAMLLGWITAMREPPIAPPVPHAPYVIPSPQPTPTMVPFLTHGSPAPYRIVRTNLDPMGRPRPVPLGLQ